MKSFFIFIGLTMLSISSFSQEKRLALVIGNSAYEHSGALPNPINDAFAMKQALSLVGFEVMEYFNLDEGEMKQAIDDFGLKLRNYDVGLFFYAGHGIQANGENYLIPVEANLMSEQQVEYDCVEAARVLAHMDASGASVNIVILDACRNNPFERSWSRSTSGQGLASMDAPLGTLIAYATAPGSTASDGTGINGLYTSALIKNITKLGLSIEDVFKQVRVIVVKESNGTQTPWESTSLVGDFYFSEVLPVAYENDRSKSPVNKWTGEWDVDYGSSLHHKLFIRMNKDSLLEGHYIFGRTQGTISVSDFSDYHLEGTWKQTGEVIGEGTFKFILVNESQFKGTYYRESQRRVFEWNGKRIEKNE